MVPESWAGPPIVGARLMPDGPRLPASVRGRAPARGSGTFLEGTNVSCVQSGLQEGTAQDHLLVKLPSA